MKQVCNTKSVCLWCTLKEIILKMNTFSLILFTNSIHNLLHKIIVFVVQKDLYMGENAVKTFHWTRNASTNVNVTLKKNNAGVKKKKSCAVFPSKCAMVERSYSYNIIHPLTYPFLKHTYFVESPRFSSFDCLTDSLSASKSELLRNMPTAAMISLLHTDRALRHVH